MSFVFWVSSSLTILAALVSLLFINVDDNSSEIVYLLEIFLIGFIVALIVSILLYIFLQEEILEKILAAAFLLMVAELIIVLFVQYIIG